MFPTAMQKRQGENAEKSMGGMRSDTPASKVDPQRHFYDFHQPHQCYYEEWDDEAAKEFPSFCFVVHTGSFIKNRSSVKC